MLRPGSVPQQYGKTMKTIKKILLLLLAFSFLVISVQAKTFLQKGYVSRIANPSFEHAVTMGLVPGVSTVDKFGINPLITDASDPEDVWEGGGIYTYDANGTAPIVSIASDDASDDQLISVQGLDISGNLVLQNAILNGTTRVALTTPLWRVFRLQNDGVKNLVGNVFVYVGTGTVPTIGDPEIRALIDNGNNQTLMALFTIPAGKVGFLYRGEAGIGATGGPSATADYAVGSYRSRRYGKVFKIKKNLTMSVNGASIFQDHRSFPDVIPALTDIKINISVVTNDLNVWATLDIMLFDEDMFPDNYLSAIGQPGY